MKLVYFFMMKNITTAALFFLAAGILTSVTILGAYQILFAIPLLYFSYETLKNKDFILPKSAYWLLAFTAIALISSLINIELMPKPMKNIGRLKYFLYGAGGIWVLKAWLKEVTDKTKRVLANTFMLTIVITSFVAFYNYSIAEDHRARGFTETMRYGYGSAMFLLVLLSALLQKKKISSWFNPNFGMVAFALGFAGMYLTYTRGSLLGFLAGLPFALYFYHKKIGLWFGASAIVMISIFAFLQLKGAPESEDSSRFLQQNVQSNTIRKSQWKAGLIAMKERPVLGWGLSNFHSQLKRIKHQYDLDAKDYDDAHSHNLFLEVGSGTGLVGLFFFLGWIVSWALEAFKAGGIIRALVVPFGVAFVVASQFEVTFDANNASMIFFLYSISTAAIQINKTSELHG
jgi:O-antigen ligase